MKNDRFAQFGPSLLRLALGVMFLAHAAQKVFVFTIPGTVGFFASLGLPAAAAYLTIFAETAGGLLLLAGWQTRAVALALLPFLSGATLAHIGNGWSFTNPHGGWEYPLFLAVSCAVQALIGAGALSLDVRRQAH